MLDGIIEILQLSILDMDIISLVGVSLRNFVMIIIYMLSMTIMIKNHVYPRAYSHYRLAMPYT